MKLSKFLLSCGVITFISCLYVHQQTEIFRLAYLGQKRIARLEELLDKNSILRYNINKSASLVNISSKISGETAGFQMPQNYRLVRVANNNEASRITAGLSKKENIIARFFGVKRQAEAKAINTSTTLSVDGERSRTINP